MQVTIPVSGSVLTLNKDWPFKLWATDLNKKIWISKFGPPEKDPSLSRFFNLATYKTLAPTRSLDDAIWRFWTDSSTHKELVIPAGTVLRIDRISINKDPHKFSYCSFSVLKWPFLDKTKNKIKAKFQAEIEDINLMEVTWDDSTIFRAGPNQRPF